MTDPATSDAPATRPAHHTVFAILHFLVGALTVPWIVVQVLVLLAADRAGTTGLGTTIIGLLLALTVTGLVFQVAGGVGLLRRARWGVQCTWLYALTAVSAGLVLWFAGDRALFATVWMLYPVSVVVVFARR